LEKSSDGIGRLVFEGIENLSQQLERLGEVPLPPYIRRNGSRLSAEDRERYQTVYARSDGSVAAPTAGLHFTPELLDRLGARGVETCFVTLHVGLGTFAPVKSEDLRAHKLHAEHFEVSSASAQTINSARAAGRRIVAVGTTTARTLEHLAAQSGGPIIAGVGTTNLFIHPPFDFRVVGALVTNFHLPRSTLLMLVSAFAAPGSLTGRATLMQAYTAAVESGYRFYSYGDSMLIL
jgi:S-adenosylmethionine:tRNA ribosyltransferase-isomerase